ncbi:hypothetical protein HD806DRAFT_382643 [Xylariaceae sp. AK1471]|nr:hypothetical protein HD806DRAFT_382643 [Xylariaceae sp. AK1471]
MASIKRPIIWISLLFGLVSGSLYSRDPSPYLPCPAGYRDGSLLIQSWHNDTHNGAMNVSFHLTTTFDKSATWCHGIFYDDGTYEEKSCDKQDSDFGTTFRANFSPLGNYVFLNHRFACLTKAPYNPVVHATGTASTTQAELLNATGDNTASLLGEFTVPPSAPRLKCSEVLGREAKWIVSNLKYSASIGTIQGGGVPSAVSEAVLDFDIFNTANDFLTHCEAIHISSTLDLEDNIIDPNYTFTCPQLYYGDPDYPDGTTRLPSNFPNTTFQFNRRERQISIHQTWECQKDDGDLLFFSANGNKTLSTDCTKVPVSQCSDEKIIVEPLLDENLI